MGRRGSGTGKGMRGASQGQVKLGINRNWSSTAGSPKSVGVGIEGMGINTYLDCSSTRIL